MLVYESCSLQVSVVDTVPHWLWYQLPGRLLMFLINVVQEPEDFSLAQQRMNWMAVPHDLDSFQGLRTIKRHLQSQRFHPRLSDVLSKASYLRTSVSPQLGITIFSPLVLVERALHYWGLDWKWRFLCTKNFSMMRRLTQTASIKMQVDIHLFSNNSNQ